MSKARQLADLGNVYDDGALSHRNLIINGAMQVAQRGTSFSGNVYTLDRFKAGNNPTDISQNTSDVPSGFQYSMNLTGSNHLINYRMESKDSFRLNGETVTLSFYAKSISGTNTLKVQLGHPSATDNFSTQTVLETSSSITLTSSWARYEVTFSSLSSEIEKGLFFFIYREGSTSSDQTRITGVQLEVGDTATPFEHRSYGQELALCQRYYQKFGSTQTYDVIAFGGIANATTQAQIPTPLIVEMRATPSVSANDIQVADAVNPAIDCTSTTISSSVHNNRIAYVQYNVASGLTQYRSYYARVSNNSNGYIAFDAEL